MSEHGAESNGFAYMQSYQVAETDFETLELPAEDILKGNPTVKFATLHEAADGSVFVGVARLTPGTVRYEQAADEFDYVVSGRLIIRSDRDDRAIECTPGSVTRLSKGVTYFKEILEPYEEIFVMLSPDGVQL
jgi:uncharacterized cupin superfamily protein